MDVEARIAELPVCGCHAVAYIHHRACPLRQAVRELADHLLSSGVLVDAADVRARTQEAAWDEGFHKAGRLILGWDDGDWPPTPNPYRRDRAVSEREGAS